MMRPPFLPLVVTLAIALASATASAQTFRSERPYRGLFGSGLDGADHSLVASGSLGGGWDNNVVASALFGERVRPTNLNTTFRGVVAQASGSLSYALNLQGLSINATGGTSVHLYPSISSAFTRRYSGGAGAALRVTRDVSINLSAQYRPYSLSSLFPEIGAGGDAALADIDFSSSLDHYVSYSAGAGYSRQLSRKTTLSANYNYRWRDASSIRAVAFVDHRAGVGLRYQVDEGLALRAGYGYMQSDRTATGGTTGAETVTNHHIDAGVDYNRSLSFSRRTTLSFGTGTSMVTHPEDPADKGTRVRLTGNVALVHELARTWNAEVTYQRNVRFDQNWGDIVSSDGVSAGVGGLLTRRLSFRGSARTSLGTIGAGGNRGYRGMYGNASLGYDLGRNASIGLTYAYYRHRFDQNVTVPSDFASAYDRHIVRASINMWAPLFQRPRRR
jgi:hypothetical protein